MKLLTYRYGERVEIGALCPDMEHIYPLRALGIRAETMQQLIIESDYEALRQLRMKVEAGCEEKISLAQVELMPPIPEPRQSVICLENNFYRDLEEKRSAVENGTEPQWPIYYYKKATLANKPGGEVPSYPDYAEELDTEPGVAMITAADIRAIPEEDAGKYIFGYTILNNIISRGLTKRHRRPVVSTGLDGFLPMGPWIVTADEFEENPVFHIETRINGRVVQSASMELMKFTQNHIVSDLCLYGILKSASIIWLGTPFGCIRDQENPVYLKSGDFIECTISGLGTLANTVK